jgi:hypothetical protein
MQTLKVARTLAEARWQNHSRTSTHTRLFSRNGEIFAAQRLHSCRLPTSASQLKLRVDGRTTEYGQKIFIGLLTLDSLNDRVTGPGLGVSIDPETGMVEDLLGDSGVVGYVYSAPQDPGAELFISLEAWVYGRTFIPRLHINGETIALPAFLIDLGQTFTSLIGGELGQGILPRVDHTELTLRPLVDVPMAHG